MGLTIANEINRQRPHQEVHSDPARQRARDRLQRIAYSELKINNTLAGFLYGLELRGVGIEPAKNKQGKTYGIRFSYEGHTFKASEIGREFGYHSLVGNFSSSPGQHQATQDPQSHGSADHHHSHGSGNIIESLSEGAATLLGSLFSLNPSPAAEDDNAPQPKKKKLKKHYYGRQ